MTVPFAFNEFPAITPIAAAVLGLLGAGLAVAVIVQRVRLGIEAGDGGDSRMAQAVRAQANFAEYAPGGLILLALLEICGTPRWVVVTGAVLLVVGRLLSAIGLSRSLGPSFPRQAGASATIVSLALCSVCLAMLVLAIL